MPHQTEMIDRAYSSEQGCYDAECARSQHADERPHVRQRECRRWLGTRAAVVLTCCRVALRIQARSVKRKLRLTYLFLTDHIAQHSLRSRQHTRVQRTH
jgi:hypothetical protein